MLFCLYPLPAPARGAVNFKICQGTVSFDDQELTVPVLAGKEITEVLIGLLWLETRRLVVDRKVGLLTLGEECGKSTWRLEVAAKQTKSAFADLLLNPPSRV